MSFDDRDGVIWFDGEMVPWRDAKVHVLTHTLHYGMGVFEGVRAYKTDQGPAIFRLEDHTKRLFNSAKILNMTIPFSHEEINQCAKSCSNRQSANQCLYPSDVLLWIRGNGLTCRQPQSTYNGCRLGMGRLPRRR